MHRQHQRRGCHQTHRVEVAHRIVRQIALQVGVDGVRGDGGEKQRVAVGGRARRELGADGAAGAGAVVDDDLLAVGGAELLRDEARQHVVAAAGGKGDDEAHRLRRVGLCRRRAAQAVRGATQKRFITR